MRSQNRSVAILVIAALASGTALAADPNLPSYWQPKVSELAPLPQYCWAQLGPEGSKAGMKTAMDICGVGMNHLCPGLIGINRASNPAYDKNYRRRILKQARIEIDYTKARVPPTCPLLPDVQAADARIRTLEQLLR